MKCIKIGNEIFSLENVKKIYVTTGGIVQIDYFNKDHTYIECGKKAKAEEVLNQIYEILLEKA
jgi:hypothetical protein